MAAMGVTVRSDVRGHITINGADGPPLVTFSDVGDRLTMWVYEGVELTPAVAAALSVELAEWARR